MADKDRTPRPGEDPLDWMLATGRMEQSTYDLVKGRGAVAASAAEPQKPARPQWERKVAASVPAGVDPAWYSLNPAVDEAAQRGLFGSSVMASRGQVPTLFASGDLPSYCASGMSPQVLASVPWPSRHPIAAAATMQEAQELLEAVSGPDGWLVSQMEHLGHPQNGDYRQRVSDWVMKGSAAAGRAETERAARVAASAVPTADSAEMTDDEMYDALFGDSDRRRQARLLEQEQMILAGRAVGHGRDVRQVRASMEARIAASGGRLAAGGQEAQQ